MRYLRLLTYFIRSSAQQELAYRANFFISLLHSLLNLGVGVLSLVVLFNQVPTLNGWDFASTLSILGVYLTVGALRGLFIGPSLDDLAGLGGEIWTGRFDFTLLRPVNVQFLASLHQWRLFSLIDLALGLGVLGAAAAQPGMDLPPARWLTFLVALGAGILALYAILLAFTALVFWSPGFLFGWVFDGLFQMARYQVGVYPGWLRLVLTWLVPVGVMTTIPAQALTGSLSAGALAASMAFALALAAGASMLFRSGLRRYASASS